MTQTEITNTEPPKIKSWVRNSLVVGVLAVMGGLLFLMSRGPSAEDAIQELVDEALASMRAGEELNVADFQTIVDTLDEALAIDPDNELTVTAVRQLQSQIGSQMVSDLQTGRLATVEAMLDIAQLAWPDVQRFAPGGEIDNRLQKELDAKRLMAEVSDIIGQAKDAIAFNEGGSQDQRLQSIALALEQLKLALAIDPNNQEAVSMKADLREELTDQIQTALDESEPAEAKELLAVAADYFETDSAFNGLHEQTNRLESNLNNFNEIERLLGAANERVSEDSLMVPLGDSAVDYFEQVLAIDASNVEAINGIERVADRYVELASVAISEGNVNTAKSYLENMSVLKPDHAEIQALRERIQQRSNNRSPEPSNAPPSRSDDSKQQPEIVPMDDEDRVWLRARGTCNRTALQQYIDRYPSGRYVDDAWGELSSCLDSNTR